MIPDNDVLEKRKRKLRDELTRAVEELKRMGAERVILIGSMALDALSPFSDIDLIVVMQAQERFLDRLKTAYGKIQPAVAMDLLIYTPQEFEEMSSTRPFLIHALKESKVLYAA